MMQALTEAELLAMSHDFGTTLNLLKAGRRMCRVGWNGRGMWLLYISGSHWDFATGPGVPTEGIRCLPFIAMRTADAGFVPWLASQTDILATDWKVVP